MPKSRLPVKWFAVPPALPGRQYSNPVDSFSAKVLRAEVNAKQEDQEQASKTTKQTPLKVN